MKVKHYKTLTLPPPLFISHMVQMKAPEEEMKIYKAVNFISHMVQMKERFPSR